MHVTEVPNLNELHFESNPNSFINSTYLQIPYNAIPFLLSEFSKNHQKPNTFFDNLFFLRQNLNITFSRNAQRSTFSLSRNLGKKFRTLMSARRRFVRSSSQGELSVFNQIRPIDSPVGFLEIKKRPPLVNNVKPRKEEEQPPPRLVSWTLGLHLTDDLQSNKKKVDDEFCGFLKACSLCKKKLEETADVYMYGYLHAFCSSECRDDQIALDGFDKEVSKEPTKMAIGGMISTKCRQGFGTKRLK